MPTQLKESRLDPARARDRRDGARRRALAGPDRAGARCFRIVDLEGNQAVDTLFFNADDPRERYSAARHHPRARATSTSPPAPRCARPTAARC